MPRRTDILRSCGNPPKAECVSDGAWVMRFFKSHIRHDPRFEIVGQQDALSMLRKR